MKRKRVNGTGAGPARLLATMSICALVVVLGCDNDREAERRSEEEAAVAVPGSDPPEVDLQPTQDIGGEEAVAIRQLQQDLIDAYNDQDLDRIMSLHHPDVAYLVPSRPVIEGWEAVRAMYEEIFTRFREDKIYLYLQATTHEVVVMGEWAWASGDAHAVMSPFGETPVITPDTQPGSKHLSIYRKENGRWLRYRQMRNGNTPEMNI